MPLRAPGQSGRTVRWDVRCRMDVDATVEELLAAIRRLPPDDPVIDPKKWYRTQHEHWIGWLEEYEGPGAYGRKRTSPTDARSVYNRVVEPKMLLWLAEAAGVAPDRVTTAKAAAQAAATMMQASGQVRRVLPWESVAAALAKPRRRRRWPHRRDA